MSDQDHDPSPDPELELLVDLHLGHERQGPGSQETTRRAIDLAGLRTKNDRPLRIADLGCGTGASALVLAETLAAGPSESSGVEIVAIDGIAAFIERLRERVADRGLSGRLEGRVADMAALPFGDREFDVLWSEGAIYNIGVEHGARTWRRHLRPGGLLAVTELSWTSADRPAEIERHWQTAYPGIATPSENGDRGVLLLPRPRDLRGARSRGGGDLRRGRRVENGGVRIRALRRPAVPAVSRRRRDHRHRPGPNLQADGHSRTDRAVLGRFGGGLEGRERLT